MRDDAQGFGKMGENWEEKDRKRGSFFLYD
jgi:hypothetical protein